ncbi:MAG: PIG-L family deacetylase [Gemmatimonadota bacterium]
MHGWLAAGFLRAPGWLAVGLPMASAAELHPTPTAAQAPIPETGTVAAGLRLRQLEGVKRVLVIGAHPDDEDTSLLTALARGLGARAAYLSLTRGEGGQNLIGPELGEALGILRTGELLAARRLDGAEQYFTRAYDFGYSKTAEESFRHWPKDSLLSDVVWVVRRFRPQVIVAIFSGTPLDGHGQHQVAGILAREAFRTAGDPERFPEQLAAGLRPWAPLKLYRRTFRDPQNADLTVETGRLDPLLGRSYHQVAMAGRSQHRSQDFGVAQSPGPFVTRLKFLESRVSRRREGGGNGLFSGIDTSLVAPLRPLPPDARAEAERAVDRYLAAVHRARGALAGLAPYGAVRHLADALASIREAIASVRSVTAPEVAEALAELEEKEGLAQEALLAAASVSLSVRAERDVVVPGETLQVTAEVWNGGPFPIRASPVRLSLPAGWSAEPPLHVAWSPPRFFAAPPRSASDAPPPVPDRGGEVAAGGIRRSRAAVHVPPTAAYSELYYVRRERDGSLYRWPASLELRALPRDPPLLRAGVTIDVRPGGATTPVRVHVERPVRYRGVDKARGEYWRPVMVAPAASVSVTPVESIWPLGDPGPRHLAVRVRAMAPRGVRGTMSLDLPAGWRSRPAEQPFRLQEGATAVFDFELQAPEEETGGGEVIVRGVARLSGGQVLSRGVTLVAYPHISPAFLFHDAVARVRRFPVQVARERRVGYLMGSGDDGPQEIRQLGLEVEPLGPERVRNGAFAGLDVIVLGIRAYETRPDLREANERLLDWVREGGTLIVQYNKREMVTGGFAPYMLHMKGRADRVTDEEAPVRLLDPEAPPLARPNRITEADFRGWVQERGLYFPDEWAPEYTPLLGMADAGEEELRGSLLVAPLGAGLYVYTSLSLFRQLPAGVPGAYRLLANLLSLRPEAWRAYREGGTSGAAR